MPAFDKPAAITIVDNIKSVVEKALIHITCARLASVAAVGLCKLLASSQLDSQTLAATVAAFAKTPLGKSVMSVMLGAALPHVNIIASVPGLTPESQAHERRA